MPDPLCQLTFLGTGTSLGVPYIGCSCRVCTSTDPRNTRRRCAIHLEVEGYHLQVDTPPDFRDQVLRFGIPRVDAVLLTHAHADHIFGFDDLRRFGELQRMVIPVWSDSRTLNEMRPKFSYVRDHVDNPENSSVPLIRWQELPKTQTTLGPFSVTPIPVPHGRELALGFLIEGGEKTIGYFPDCSALPPETLARLSGIDILILNTLRHIPHPKHLHWDLALELVAEIHARQTYLIHLSHDIEHTEGNAALPDGVQLSYDGLVLPLE